MKFCMIGSRGHWGYVFESIKEVPYVEITAVSSGSEDSPQNLLDKAQEFGFDPQVFDDYRVMLDEARPELVCIDGPFHRHAEMCVEALSRNINVFCEKPVALTLDDLDRIETAWKNSNAKIFSMVGLRYEAPFQTAQKLVAAGAIGKVKMINCRKSYRLGTRPDYFKKRATYGGTIPWVGSHALDWMMFFSGSTFHTVWAAQTAEDNFGNGELEIAAQCQAVMKNGVLCQASIDYLRPASAPTHGDDRVRVAGTAGVIEVAGGGITLIDSQGERKIEPLEGCRLFADICNDVTGRGAALVDSAQTIELTRGCLCAQRAADENKIIAL